MSAISWYKSRAGRILYLPQHLERCLHCGYKGYTFIRLPDLPPCSVKTTTVLNTVLSPKIGPLTLAGSDLTFVDGMGTPGPLSGTGHLIRQPSAKPGTLGWTASAKVAGPTTAHDQSARRPGLGTQWTVSAPATVDQDLNVPLSWWSGAGSNRRPSAFQEEFPGPQVHHRPPDQAR